MPRTRKVETQTLPEGSVVVDLSKPPPDAERGKPAPQAAVTDYSGPKPLIEQPKPIKTITQPEVPAAEVVPPGGDGEGDLAAQVERLKTAEKKAKERADQAEAQRQQDVLNAQRAVQQSKTETEHAQYESVVNALAATKVEADQLQQHYEDALATNDHKKAAEVHRAMVKAETRLSQLEEGKLEFERTFEDRKKNPPQPVQQQQPANIENILAQMPALTNDERDWLRQHPDAVTNQRQVARLQVAYLDAEQQGIKRGSKEYFRFFEDRLGYDPDPEDPEYEQEDGIPMSEPEPEPHRRVAAPVSRQAPGATQRRVQDDTKIVLTPQQREAARISGTDEFTYAQNLKRLREMKSKGYYQETG